MKTSIKTASILAAGLMLAGVGAHAVLAKTTTPVDVTDTVGNGNDGNNQSDLQKALKSGNIVQIKAVADTMIDGRISVLNELTSDIASFKHVSSDDKATLTSNVNTNLSAMTALRAKIDAEAVPTTTASSSTMVTLRADAISITKNYRIGILVRPQVKQTLVADKIESIYTIFGNLISNLQTQVNTKLWVNQAAKDHAQSVLDDMKQQVENANGAAIKAEADIGGLVPDHGDKAVLDQNNTQLQDAKNSLQIAVDDLKTARTDVDTIQSLLNGTVTR